MLPSEEVDSWSRAYLESYVLKRRKGFPVNNHFELRVMAIHLLAEEGRAK